MSIYYKWKNTVDSKIKLKRGMISLNYQMVLIQYIIKRHEKLANNSPIHIYINRTIKRLVFEIKEGSKIETQRTETITLFGSTKKIIDNTRNRENVPSLDLVEVVLVRCNLVDKDINKILRYYIILHSLTFMLIS